MPMIRVNPDQPEPEPIARAAEVIRRGGLVAFPTETVYGLGANALDALAVRRIFEAKGRPSFNPLIAHVASEAGARALAADWPPAAARLAEAFWPGPLTLVLPKRPIVPDVVTAGLAAVALRVPAHPVALALLESAELPIAAPSANRFTELSPTTAQHVAKALESRIDLILDGGPTMVGIESTVVDLTGPRPVILRPGVLSSDELARVVGPIAPATGRPTGSEARLSPGLTERHYAPRAELRFFDRGDEREAALLAARAEGAGRRVGALLLRADQPAAAAPRAHVVRMPSDPVRYARRLYAALHDFDDLCCDIVLVERVPDDPAWAGVRDRLERAGTPPG